MTGLTEQVSVSALKEAVAQLFVASGIEKSAAEIVAGDLVAADVEGLGSHGVMLVPMYLDRIRAGSVSLDTKGCIISDRGSTIVLDGRDVLGQLTGRQATRLVIQKAKSNGLGAVALRNGFHLGALGLYARLMADENCYGIVTTNTRPLLPAPGGAEALTGNNPIVLAAPSSGEFHAEVDMALSAVAMGKIRNAAASGIAIPDNWATDRDGRPTTDPDDAINGMLLPAAGPKGFGMAFLLDLLAGGLSGGGIGPEVSGLYGDPSVPYGCAAFFIAIDVDHFTDARSLSERTAAVLKRTSESKTAPGVERVFAPGEMAFAARSKAGGICTITTAALDALFKAGDVLHVDLTFLSPMETHA